MTTTPHAHTRARVHTTAKHLATPSAAIDFRHRRYSLLFYKTTTVVVLWLSRPYHSLSLSLTLSLSRSFSLSRSHELYTCATRSGRLAHSWTECPIYLCSLSLHLQVYMMVRHPFRYFFDIYLTIYANNLFMYLYL